MEPIAAALVAGATLVLRTATSEAVKDAYKAVKTYLAGKISVLSALELSPQNEVFQQAVAEQVRISHAADDSTLLEKARELIDAIGREPPHNLTEAGIDIANIQASGKILVKNLKATSGITVRDLDAKAGNIHIEGIEAGGVRKN